MRTPDREPMWHGWAPAGKTVEAQVSEPEVVAEILDQHGRRISVMYDRKMVQVGFNRVPASKVWRIK